MTKAAELRELSTEELRTRERELEQELFRLRMQKATGRLESPAKFRLVRRDLARVKTLIRERQLRGEPA